MKSYGDITLKYISKNKKRTFFTVIGIILSLSLISGLGFLYYSFQDFLVERDKINNGDYEAVYYNVNKNQLDILINDADLEKVGATKHELLSIDGHSENTVELSECDTNAMNEVFTIRLVEGSLPKNSKEIIIDKTSKDSLGLEIGQEITLVDNMQHEENIFTNKTSKDSEGLEIEQEITLVDNMQHEEEQNKKANGDKTTYKIVGFEERPYYTGKMFVAHTFLDDLNGNEETSVYFTLKDKKDKVEIAKEKGKKLGIDEKNIRFNNSRLAFEGESTYDGINLVMDTMSIFVLLVIILATIFLIYNAINISVAERIKEFGILRSIGATPKQIRNIVLKEGFIMCLISVPFGILFGFSGVYITIALLKNSLANMFGEGFKLEFYPMVVLLTLIVGIVTIFIACFGPARRAGSISPIDILKANGTDIGKNKIKYYKGNLIRKVFGLEGWIAYKNIRKNKKRFIITILSISTSLIMFIIFNTMNIKQEADLDYIKKTKIGDAEIRASESFEKESIDKDIKGIDGINEVYEFSQIHAPLLINKSHLTDKYVNSSEFADMSKDIKEGARFKDDYILSETSSIYKYNDFSLKEIGFSKADLGIDGVILVNTKKDNTTDGKMEKFNITNYKVGDTIKFPKSLFIKLEKSGDEKFYEYLSSEKYIEDMIKEINNNEVYEFKVKGIIEKTPFDSSNYNFSIIFPEKFYDSINKDKAGINNWVVKFPSSDEKEIERISKALDNVANKNSIFCGNEYVRNKRAKERWTVINVFIFGFIAMITLIGVVNVINTIAINILLKKKEFGTLEAIGMSRVQLMKMIILEGVLHGVIASIIGGVVSFGLVKIMIRIMNEGVTMTNTVPVMPFIIGFEGVIIITLIASLIPLRKLKKITIVEAIRDNE